MSEAKLKSNCTKRLQSAGWLVIHLIQTNQNGIPDTLILRNGEYIFIEFKRPGKNPEELQKYRIRKLKEALAKVIVVRSLDDIAHLL